MLARGKRCLADWSSPSSSGSELSAAAENVGAPETVPGGGDHPRDGAAREVNDADDSASEGKEAEDANGNEEPFRFLHFDVRDCPLDHHYLDTADQVSTTKC